MSERGRRSVSWVKILISLGTIVGNLDIEIFGLVFPVKRKKNKSDLSCAVLRFSCLLRSETSLIGNKVDNPSGFGLAASESAVEIR